MTDIDRKLLEIKKEKEEKDKKLLSLEIVIGVISIVIFLVFVLIASFADINDNARLLIIIPSTIFVVVISFILLKIEQIAGYYECRNCHHRYVPKYSSVLWAMHIGRTRYMKCPLCKKKSWNKKVISFGDGID